ELTRLPQPRQTCHTAEDEPEAEPPGRAGWPPEAPRGAGAPGRVLLAEVPQPAQGYHGAPQRGETTPEALTRPPRPRVVEPQKRGSARVDNLDRVWEGMRIEHRAEEGGDFARGMVNDNNSPRGGREGRLHNGISSSLPGLGSPREARERAEQGERRSK